MRYTSNHVASSKRADQSEHVKTVNGASRADDKDSLDQRRLRITSSVANVYDQGYPAIM
jgi:hypothetical protein